MNDIEGQSGENPENEEEALRIRPPFDKAEMTTLLIDCMYEIKHEGGVQEFRRFMRSFIGMIQTHNDFTLEQYINRGARMAWHWREGLMIDRWTEEKYGNIERSGGGEATEG